MKHQQNVSTSPIASGQIDTNALDTPPVALPTIPCSRPGCERPGDLMVIKSGEKEYSFWCGTHVPKPPVLTPPEEQR